ncbi:hypothetical protein [Achromobacter sp. JUb104]|uniref:hypothetical protein n=1 Tax=Achromobacter sp. JUb104 TaxID=2940590 RepID=UPI00216986BE|nr:hypothetical protein [Achromobacter sp. JUb104]MCS3509781.1 hypothetical protein [Achromobacter sp. JUb104]
MRIFQEGDRSQAFCRDCAALVSTTFVRRDVPFSDGSGAVKGLLIGACDSCGATVSIPAQSTPAISKARKQALESIETNLPAIYVDILDYIVHTIDHRASTDFRRVLLTYFMHKAANDAQAPEMLRQTFQRALEAFPERRGAARRRLSMKVPARVTEDLRRLEASTLLNKTDLIKSVVFDMRDKVLDKPRPGLIEELRILSAISA